MINVKDNVYIPSEGYKYITNGEVFATEIMLGRNQNINDWYDTNDEPPEPTYEEEVPSGLEVE